MELKKLSGILSFTKSMSCQALRNAQVRGGKLHATDLTTFLTIKNFCGLSDGYYLASDLKVKRLDETVGEFPMFDAYLSAKEMISIEVKTLETFMLHASNDLTRIYLNTVVFDKDTIVATNGYHLKHSPLKDKLENTYLVPTCSLKVLVNLAKAYKLKSLAIGFDGCHAVIDTENFRLVSKLCPHDYLRYQAVIPRKTAHTMQIVDMVNFKALKPFIDKKTNACKLVSENGTVTFEIPNNDIKVPVGHSDRLDKFEVGFNFKYLEICCEKMKAFTVKYNNELSPVVIDDNRIIMPIKLDKIIK